jgi:deoxycytidine triphosphate deaminase
MAIIPWVRAKDGGKPTVVERMEDFQFEGEVVLVKGFDGKQFDKSENTNVSYDLHVGEEYRRFGEPNKKSLKTKQVIQLLPGTGAIIRLKEEVHFPKTRFGQIIPKASLLQEGIANWPTKIDPGYDGPLFVTVFNYGAKPYELKHNEKFCALYILDVDKGVRPYRKASKSFPGETERGLHQRFSDSLKANYPLVSVITAILFLASLILGIINFFRSP